MTDKPDDDTITIALGDDVLDQMVLNTVAMSYRVMTRMMLGTASEHEIDHLRGMARIGLETPPEDDFAKALHADVMAVLEKCGLEPLTSEEVEAAIQHAIEGIMATQQGSQGPTLVQ